MPGVKKVDEGARHRGGGRRRHLVARQDRARRASRSSGTKATTPRSPTRPSRSTSRTVSRRPRTTASAGTAMPLAAIAGAAKKVEATYSTPFLSHACMEMMNATVKLSAGKAECWVPTQNLEASLAALSEASGIPLAQCEVHRHDLGGGFGRRGGTQDYVHQAVAIAKEFPDTPVKLIWSREEDQAHDFYRPISVCKMSAGLDEKGELVGLHVRSSGQSINAWLNPTGIVERQGPPPASGLVGGTERRAARLHGAEPAARIRDAQHACSGRPLARGQHQPERRLHGVLHRGMRAGGRQGLARIPPRPDEQASQAPRGAQCRRRERRLGQAVACRASIAASRSSWATAAIRPRPPKSRSTPRAS